MTGCAKKVVYLASDVTLGKGAGRRIDAFEHDQMMEALVPAFAAEDMDIEAVSWSAEGANWADYDAAIIGTTWDYWDHYSDFIKTLEVIESQTRLFNSKAVAEWNSNKRYLQELSAKGITTIDTLWRDHVRQSDLDEAFEQFGTPRLVIKRQIGAGADGQHLVDQRSRDFVSDRPVMIQPYLRSVAERGEVSLVYVEGSLSHALLKQAKRGDYRVQSIYGGTEATFEPDAAMTAFADGVIAALDEVPLYARIDIIWDEAGALRLIEIEMVEPFLYPLQGPDLGPRLAAAVARRLKGDGA